MMTESQKLVNLISDTLTHAAQSQIFAGIGTSINVNVHSTDNDVMPLIRTAVRCGWEVNTNQGIVWVNKQFQGHRITIFAPTCSSEEAAANLYASLCALRDEDRLEEEREEETV